MQRVEKSRTRKDFLARFLVEVTGFEPATFWSRKMEEYPLVSSVDRNCLIIPDRNATICFASRFAFRKIYGLLKTLLTAIRFYPDSNLEMNHIFGFRIFDIPKTLHSTLHQDSIQLIIMRLKSGLNPVGTGVFGW